MSGRLDGLVAAVSGGASGIGAAVVRTLRADGARVAVLDLTEPAQQVDLAVRVDVTDDHQVRAGVDLVVERLGGLDILVNCAGIGAQGDVSANTDDEWHRVFDVNVIGTARLTRAALPHLRRSAHPSVVNLASVAAWIGLPERALYTASKGAVLALTRALAADHLGDGIRVNSVSPGTADTPWVQRLLDGAADPVAERAALMARQPHGRLVSAEEIAEAVCHLASPSAASTTGTDLAVDGGLLALRPRPHSAPRA